MRTANPALGDKSFSVRNNKATSMTIKGTANRTLLLLLALLVSAYYTWSQYFNGFGVSGSLMVGLIAGFILALITILYQKWRPSHRFLMR